MNVISINLPNCHQNEFFEYYKTGNYPLNHITKEPVEYKKKIQIGKAKFG